MPLHCGEVKIPVPTNQWPLAARRSSELLLRVARVADLRRASLDMSSLKALSLSTKHSALKGLWCLRNGRRLLSGTRSLLSWKSTEDEGVRGVFPAHRHVVPTSAFKPLFCPFPRFFLIVSRAGEEILLSCSEYVLLSRSGAQSTTGEHSIELRGWLSMAASRQASLNQRAEDGSALTEAVHVLLVSVSARRCVCGRNRIQCTLRKNDGRVFRAATNDNTRRRELWQKGEVWRKTSPCLSQRVSTDIAGKAAKNQFSKNDSWSWHSTVKRQ